MTVQQYVYIPHLNFDFLRQSSVWNCLFAMYMHEEKIHLCKSKQNLVSMLVFSMTARWEKHTKESSENDLIWYRRQILFWWRDYCCVNKKCSLTLGRFWTEFCDWAAPRSVLLQLHCCNNRALVLACPALADIALYSTLVLKIDRPYSSSHMSAVSWIMLLSQEGNPILPMGQLNIHAEQKFIEFLVPKAISRDLPPCL